MQHKYSRIAQWALLAVVLAWMWGSRTTEAAVLNEETIEAWDTYVAATESRRAEELASPKKFLALDFREDGKSERERRELFEGQIPVTRMTTLNNQGKKIEVPRGMIHHWRGAVFIPGVALDEVYARVANPSIEDTRQDDVLDSSILERDSDSLKLFLKLQRSKIVTVVYNTEHQVHFQRSYTDKAWSRSFTTKIAEVKNPNTADEQEKPEGNDLGFLWRLNSYWRYQQVDGGVIVECESITLSRSIPSVFKLMVMPLINKVAHESMERTLDSMRVRLTRGRKAAENIASVQSRK